MPTCLPQDRILAKAFEPAALYARLAHFTGRLAAKAGSDPATQGQVAYCGVPGLHAQLDELERSAPA